MFGGKQKDRSGERRLTEQNESQQQERMADQH